MGLPPCPGEVGNLREAAVPELRRSHRPREQGCGKRAACPRGKQRLPRLDWHRRYRDRINIRWPELASSMRQESRGPDGNITQAIETQYPVLPPLKYIQRSTWIWPPSVRVGGLAWGWSVGRPLLPPSSCLSRLPWEVASESQILGFTVISLKKKQPKKTPTQFFFKGFPCSNLHLEKQLKLFFSDWSGSAFKQWNKLGKPYVWSHRDMTRN